MTPAWRAALRAAVIALGAAVTLQSLLEIDPANWRIYVVFFLLSSALFPPAVEVLPRLALAIPEMATTIGFLYIGGAPIIVLRIFAPALTQAVRAILPSRWKERVPHLRAEALVARRELLAEGLAPGSRLHVGTVAEYANFALGLAARWWIVSALVGPYVPVTNAGAIALAELGGYACWGVLSILPIYPNGTLLPLKAAGGLRAALWDIFLIVVLALTPFVFLISYGFRAHGLAGAAAWSLSALGLHFMLRQLNERRLRVEEQNRRLEALNRELEHRERLSAIGKMSSVVSHQILQQLGVIGIYADLIRNADEGTEPKAVLAQARENATAIEGALRDVNRVLTDLLVFSRDLRLNLYEHPLARVIDECLDDCRAEAAERRVVLRAQCSGTINAVFDKLKVKQALINIIRNALDASPPAGEVVVRAAERDDGVEITVSDHGPGVPAANREDIFAPFFTTKEHGTGLGLAIARAFVEAHGGRVWVSDAPHGSGATFIVHLPRAPQAAAVLLQDGAPAKRVVERSA